MDRGFGLGWTKPLALPHFTRHRWNFRSVHYNGWKAWASTLASIYLACIYEFALTHECPTVAHKAPALTSGEDGGMNESGNSYIYVHFIMETTHQWQHGLHILPDYLVASWA